MSFIPALSSGRLGEPFDGDVVLVVVVQSRRAEGGELGGGAAGQRNRTVQVAYERLPVRRVPSSRHTSLPGRLPAKELPLDAFGSWRSATMFE